MRVIKAGGSDYAEFTLKKIQRKTRNTKKRTGGRCVRRCLDFGGRLIEFVRGAFGLFGSCRKKGPRKTHFCEG